MRRQVCNCGHDRAAHEHYRRGSDCAICPPGECPRYDGPKRPWWHALSFVGRRSGGPAGGSQPFRRDDEDGDSAAGGSALAALIAR